MEGIAKIVKSLKSVVRKDNKTSSQLSQSKCFIVGVVYLRLDGTMSNVPSILLQIFLPMKEQKNIWTQKSHFFLFGNVFHKPRYFLCKL